MTRVVLLDTGPLGLVTNPKGGQDADRCRSWLQDLLAAGTRVVVPGIADYELRRELLRADKSEGLRRLDELMTTLNYLPINREVLARAAGFWAEARKGGYSTAPGHALDADCILAAQAFLAPKLLKFARKERARGISPIVGTTNPGHLGRFVPARLWSEITP